MSGPFIIAVLSLLRPEPAEGLMWTIVSACPAQPSKEGLLVLPAMPNPSMGAASIGIVGDQTRDVRVALCDIEGYSIGSTALTDLEPGHYELAVSGLEPGSYICVVSSDGFVESDTLVVER